MVPLGGKLMHRCTKTWLWTAGLAWLACGDDEKPPVISSQTSWQIGCVPGGTTCGTSRDAHRPSDTVTIEVQKCTRDSDTDELSVVLVDKGQQSSAGVWSRSPSKYTVQRLNPSINRCSVVIEEPCRVTGAFDRNDWDFDGTIVCNGLRQDGQGPPDFRLQGAGSSGEPAVLQLANCK
jgi:hypothetical protein